MAARGTASGEQQEQWLPIKPQGAGRLREANQPRVHVHACVPDKLEHRMDSMTRSPCVYAACRCDA
eukprot:1158473-Pelagomonas_calceolata.AAC.12